MPAPKPEEVRASEVFDSHFIQTIEKDAAGVADVSTIRTSRLIVLTQAEKTELGKAVHVAKTGDLAVYGDIVRVDGIIQVPGRKVKIVCRQLEFHPRAGSSGIDVSGEKGEDGKPGWTLAAEDGKHGAEGARAGQPGKAGKDGADGQPGQKGGTIEIYCDILRRFAPVTLAAKGGRGGNGAEGQPGGKGGDGFSNYKGTVCDARGNVEPSIPTANCIPERGYPSKPCELSAPSHGGEGGCGGNGGNGAPGGTGGNIKLFFRLLDNDPEGKRKVALSVTGGDGGNGGRGGAGGPGGNGGNPLNYERHFYHDPIHYLDGADAGGGGIHGFPGFGGLANGSGEIVLSKPGDSYQRFELKLPQPPLRAPILNAPRPDPDPDLPPNLSARDRAAAIAKAKNDASLYQVTLAAYNKAKKEWSSECDRLKESAAYFPDPQKSGRDADFPGNLNECAPAGKPGKAAQSPKDPSLGGGTYWRHGQDGSSRPPNKTRNAKSPRVAPEPGHLTTQQVQEVSYKDLADQADFEQLEMLLDHLRVRYLLANVFSENYDPKPLQEILRWVFELADCKAGKPLLTPAPAAAPAPIPAPAPVPAKPPADGDVWAQLRASAAATLENLQWRFNIFGQNDTFTALGDLESYKKDLGKMLGLYAPVEAAHKQLNAALIAGQERDAYLSNVSLQQTGLIDALHNALADAKTNLESALKEIHELDASKERAADSFKAAIGRLEAEIGHACGITPADIFNALTQLSFTNTHWFDPGGALVPAAPAAAGAMLVSQIGDLVTKAADNVLTDTGGSINKNLVIRRMEYLSGDVKTMAALKATRDGFLKTDPNAEYRLLATREQVEQICSNFYKSYPDAKKASAELDEYIEAVAARNQKVEEYNQLLSGLTYIASELLRTKAQKQLTDTAHQGAAQPGLPAMAKFSRALRRHAWEDCVEIMYIASRIYTLKSLDPYDVFSKVLGKLAVGNDPAELNSEALNTGLIDLISADLKSRLNKKTISQGFGQTGAPCSVILSSKKLSVAGAVIFVRPDLINLLKNGKPAKFRILLADRDATIDQNPFAGKADVRLTHITCTPKGIKTANNTFTIQLTHPGSENFIDETGREVALHHNPTSLTFTGTSSAEVGLGPDHTLIGPFCEWTIEIPKAYNPGLNGVNPTAKLESIRFDFKGEFRTPRWGDRENADHGAGAGAGG